MKKINVKLIMKIKMIKLFLVFIIFYLVFTFPVLAQEAPPTTSPTQVVASAGSPFNVGWNYFTVSAPECTLKNVFNEFQAAGGGALIVQTIWREENSQWKMFNVADLNNTKVNSDNIFAFNSNQKFYLNIAPDACKTKNTNRDLQIEQVRNLSTGKKEDSFLDKLLSVPGDFWSGLWGKMEVNKQENSLSNVDSSSQTPVFNTLNVSGKTLLNDLGITGTITNGLLSIDGLNSSINSLTDIKLKTPGGQITIDKDGNLIVLNTITAQKVEADQFVTAKAAGSSVLPANTVSVDVTAENATQTSKILITPTTITDRILIVIQKQDGKFTVGVKQADSQDIKFDWFIVN